MPVDSTDEETLQDGKGKWYDFLAFSRDAQKNTLLGAIAIAIGCVLVVAVIGQIRLLSAVKNTQARLVEIEKTLSEAKSVFSKEAAERGTMEEKINLELERVNSILFKDSLNKLRDGQVERRLIRKSAGDWFVINGKKEEIVTAPELIGALNLEYQREKKALSPAQPLPPHTDNAICTLRPDRKGGTMVSFVNEYIMEAKK